MAITLPPDLASIFSAVAGMTWPQANEDDLRTAGDDYQIIADDIPKLKEYIVELVNICLEQFEGEAADAFVASMRELIGQTGGTDYLGQAATQAGELAGVAHDTANQVEYTKWMVIGQLVMLVAEILFDIFWAPFTFGESLLNITWEWALVREAIQIIFKWLLKSIAMHTFTGVAQSLLLDGVIQGIQFAQGHRHEWDTNSTLQAFEFGLITGALSGPLDLAGMGLGKVFGGAIGKSAGSILGHELGDAMKDTLGHAGEGVLEGEAAAAGKWLDDQGAKAFARDVGNLMGAASPQIRQGFTKFGEGSIAAAFEDRFARTFERHLGPVLGEGTAETLGKDFGRTFAKEWRNTDADVRASLTRLLHDAPVSDTGVKALADTLPELAQHMNEGNTMFTVGHAIGEQLKEGALNNLSEGFYNLIFSDSHQFTSTWATFGSGVAMGLLGKVGHHMASPISARFADYVANWQHAPIHEGDSHYFGPLHPLTVLSLASNLAGHPAPFPVPRLGPHTDAASGIPVGDTMKTSSGGPGRHGFGSEKEPLLGSGASVRTESSLDSPRTSISSEPPDFSGPHETVGGHEAVEPHESIGPPEAVRTHSGNDTATATNHPATDPAHTGTAKTDRTPEPPPDAPTPRPTQSDDGPAPVPHDHTPGPSPVPDHTVPAPRQEEAPSHRVDLPAGVWFPRAHSTPRHETAARAVPGADGWRLVVGHGAPGKMEIGGVPVNAETALTHIGTGDKLTFATCYAAKPGDDGFSLAMDAHLRTGKETLGPTHETIVTTGGEVISGVFGIDKAGRPVVMPTGDWVVFRDGVPHSLDTPSLKEAYAKLGAQEEAGGPAPDEAVGFVYGISAAQHGALTQYGYAAPAYPSVDHAVPDPGLADSFFTSLRSMAENDLRPYFSNQQPTPARIRQAMHTALRSDLNHANPRYDRFLTPGQDVNQLLASLADHTQWTPQLGELAPHLAADLFNLRLGVVGASGRPENAGLVMGRSRTGHADGSPYLLVRVGDNHFVPTVRTGGPALAVPRADQIHGLPNTIGHGTWTRPLTPDEQRLVAQAGEDAMRHPAVEPRVGPQTTLAHAQATVAYLHDAISAPDGVLATNLRNRLRDLIGRALTGEPTAIDGLDALERVAYYHEMSTTGGPMDETRYIWRIQQVGTAEGTPISNGDALTAARAHAYHELGGGSVRDALGIPLPAGTGIRSRIGALGAAARHAMDTAGTRARDDLVTATRNAVPPPRIHPDTPADARGAAMAVHRRRLDESERDAKRPGGPADQAERAAREPALRPHVDSFYTPQEFDRMRWALLAHSIPNHITSAEHAGTDAVARIVDTLQAPARDSAEWEIRADAARHEQLTADPPRQLPAGFGERDADGRRQYPMGYRGRLMRLGDAWFGDDTAIANLVGGHAPVGAELRNAINTAVREHLTGLGNRAVAQRMLEGGLRFSVTSGGERHEVRVLLHLGEPPRAQYLPAFESQRDERDAPASQQTPLGQKHHGAVESDHERIAGTRKAGSTSRSMAVNVNITSPFGAQPARIFSGGAEVGLDAESGKGWSHGNDGVSATKRFLDVAGKESHFDFPRARLTVQVRRGAADPAAPRTNTAMLPARFGFPKELTPRQPDGGGPVMPDPAARRGAGNPFHGVTPAQLHAGAVAAPDTAERVHDVLGTVLHIPESISGLGTLRDQLINNLPHPVETGSDLYDGIQHWISETNLLRNYGEMTSIGTLSPAYRTGDGDTSAYLTVTSTMLGAQRVGDDHVPMKEESQRWVNTNSGTSESGSFGVTPIKGNIGYTIGDPSASFGFNHSLGVGGNVGAKLSTTRSSNENTGAGEVRGLVYDGPSVLYRLTTRMTVAVTSDAEGYANDDRPLATRDVTTFTRVPIHEAPRFEALIDRETAGPVDSVPWRSVRVPRDLDPRPADPIALQAMITAENTPRHPPTSIEAGQGIGFSAIGRLSGSEKVIPEIEATLKKVEYSRAWIPDWAPMELKYLRHQLLAKFSKEGLINRGSALFQPGGVKERLYRPVDGGTEVITITVKAKKTNLIPVAGRVASTKLELMPAGFAGESGADSLSSTLSGAANVGFTAGIANATRDRLRQFGFSLEGSAGSGKSASTSVGASGFQIQAMLYNGPARTFDYNIRYEVTVGVRYRHRATGPGDWAKIAYNRLKGTRSKPDLAMGGAARNQRITGGEAQLTATVPFGQNTPHQVRFVVPENLAPAARALHPDVGKRTEYDYTVPPPRPGNRHNGGKPTITLPDLPPAVKNTHTPLNGDDIVMETIGSEHLEKEVGELLSRVGIDPDKAGDVTWVATGAEMLTGAQVRGPSSITATMVKQGIIKDENTVIRIEGFPLNGTATQQSLNTLRMDVAEGGGNVSGSHGSSKDSGYKLGANFGTLAGENGGAQQAFPGINHAGEIPGIPRSASSHTTALGPISGRLTQFTEHYVEHSADMAYRITVVNQAKNMVSSDVPRVAGSVIKIAYGIHYLRSNAAHADPHNPNVSGAIAQAPAGKPTLIRTALPQSGDPAGHRTRRNGDKIIRDFPATPHDRDELLAGRPGRRLPTDGLVPHAAASERLLVRPGGGPHYDVTGEGNPILSGVQRLLQNHAPAALEDYWQTVGTGAKERPVPTKLSNLLNVGSAEALIDTMLGPGLILHTTRSGFLHNERVWVLLRAHRDPDNKGYYYLENVPQANVARYHFRTNRSEAGRSRPRGFEWSSGTKVSENPANAGRVNSGILNPNASAAHSSSEGSAVAKVDASRNTLFIGGEADRYAGDLRIDMVLVTTPNPSRLLNTTFFTLPDKVSMVLHDKLDMSKADGRESVTLTERVLIPQQLLKPDIEEYVPHANVAVAEVAFGSTPALLGGAPLPVTDQQLMDRSVFNLGMDPDKLQVLSDEVFKRLGGNVPTDDDSFDSATARMAGHGSRARDAIYTMLSSPMMTNELEFMVGPDGLVSPPLVREGGPFTDTHAKVTIKAELFDPRIRNYFNGSLESNSYHFVESNKNKSDGDSWGLGNSSGLTGVSGSTDPQPPGSHAAQKPGGLLSFGVKQSTSESSFVVHKDMPRVVSRNRTEPWLRVKSDVLLKITVEARNQRGPLDFPGGTTRMAFHIRNGVELAFSPEHALRTLNVAALHAHGVPTPSGVLIPAKGFAGVRDDAMAQLQAAFTFPPIQNALVIHVHGDPGVAGNFVVGGRSMPPFEFAATVLARHRPTAGQYLVFVGCRVNQPINGGPSAAEIIATRYRGVYVIGTQGVALTTSSGPVLTGVFTGNGLRPGAVGWKGDWILTEVPIGQPANAVHLGHDLIAALRTRGLGIGAPPGGSLPPTRPVAWGGGSSGTASGRGGADDCAAPDRGKDPLVMPPSDWTSVFGGAGDTG